MCSVDKYSSSDCFGEAPIPVGNESFEWQICDEIVSAWVVVNVRGKFTQTVYNLLNWQADFIERYHCRKTIHTQSRMLSLMTCRDLFQIHRSDWPTVILQTKPTSSV